MAWVVCDQWQNGSNSEMMLTVELHRSFRRTAASSRGLSLFNLTFGRMQQAISHSSTARSQLLDTIIRLGMPWLGLVFLSWVMNSKWNNNNRTISITPGHSDGVNMQNPRERVHDSRLSWRSMITKNVTNIQYMNCKVSFFSQFLKSSVLLLLPIALYINIGP